MSADLAAELADRLREAHRTVRAMDLSDDEKARATRRLVALSDTAKVDLASASRRLDRLLTELADSHGSRPDDDREGP